MIVMPGAHHATPLEGVLSELHSGVAGLSDGEARTRLTRFGPNRLEPARPVPPLVILLNQLRSVVVVLLIAAGAISLALGERLEAGAIGAVLLLDTVIGFMTEWRARRSMDALLRLEVPRASVVRAGHLRSVDAAELVPGDVVQIDAGDEVPADARLIEATDLRTNEAALTGESLPVAKTSGVLDVDTPLAERRNMVYKGTTVAAGTARAVVTGTGAGTELGRIGTLVATVSAGPTPLEQRLDDLGKRVVWLAIGVAAAVAALEWARGGPVGLVLETGIALAVAAVPEALPAVATIALAIGMHRMAQRRVLIRRLPVVETLGSTTVVCSDKTRTLTSGVMTVVAIWAAGREITLPSMSGPGDSAALEPSLRTAALASRPRGVSRDGDRAPAGDPVDLAVLAAAEQAGIDRAALLRHLPPLGTVPFSSHRKLMASFHARDGDTVAFVKGAPQRVVDLCSRIRTANDERQLDEDGRAGLIATNEKLAARGLRVLAVASGTTSGPAEDALVDLTFEAFLGLADPPAAGAKETIARLRDAGLRTVMITGDQRRTADAVGRELGLLTRGDEVMDGAQLDRVDGVDRESRIGRVAAFSRVTPEHKLAIVTALQAQGQIVAMLGDGVNDAPALKKADVGVAMGLRGTDVAKEAAGVVLQDDRFESVAAAVEEGRVIFDNIRKVVFYLFSCNIAEILVLLVAGLTSLPPPLAPLQLLWLNMITDTFPALALAVEPGDPDVMQRPPRDPDEALLSRGFVISVFVYGGVITVSTLAAYAWGLRASPEHAQTIAFMTLAFAQIAHLGNARSPAPVLLPARAAANRYAIGAVLVSVGLQTAVLEVPLLTAALRVHPLTGREWMVVLVCAVVPAIAGQAYKLARSYYPHERPI